MTNLALAKASPPSWLGSRDGSGTDNSASAASSGSPPSASPPNPSSSSRSFQPTLPNSDHTNSFDDRLQKHQRSVNDLRSEHFLNPYALPSQHAEAIRQCLLNPQTALTHGREMPNKSGNLLCFSTAMSLPNQHLSSSSSKSSFNPRLSPSQQSHLFQSYNSPLEVELNCRKQSVSPLSSRSNSSFEFPEMLPFSVSPPLSNGSAFSLRSNLGTQCPSSSSALQDFNAGLLGLTRPLFPLGHSTEEQRKVSSLLDGPRLVRETPADLTIPSNCSEIMRNMAAKYNFNKIGSFGGAPSFPSVYPEVSARPSLLQHRKQSLLPSLLPAESFIPLNSSRSSVLPKGNVKVSSCATSTARSLQSPMSLPVTTADCMSSAQMLINMVRNVSSLQHHRSFSQNTTNTSLASETHASVLNPIHFTPESIASSFPNLPAASVGQKRCIESSPLDLSPPHSQPKRARLESEDIDVENDDKSEIYSHNEHYSAPVSNENESESVSVGDYSLKSSQLMNALSLPEDPLKWTVTDVYNFVKSIDICAEYADIFREQRIDGCGLSLLTESHLTTSLHLKLGPALKLRALFDCQMNRNADNRNCAQCPATDADNCFSCDSDVAASEAGAREGSSIHLHHEKEL